MKRKYKSLPARKAGHSQWFKRSEPPVNPGEYECIAWFTSSAPSSIWRLQWDGHGFLTPIPMVVDYWRGLTRAGLKRAQAAAKERTQQ